MRNSAISESSWGERIFRYGVALGLTALLLVFLVMMHWAEPDNETLTLRSMEGITEPAALPAPQPPPPAPPQTPPPPSPPAEALDLPKFDLSVNEIAPPVRAALAELPFKINMAPASFSAALPQTKGASLFLASDLDNQPRLLNRPIVTFPPSQTKLGVKEGNVTLEVMINSAGNVLVRRILTSSHPDFIPMARTFASHARFSPPKKDGRIVNAVFNWPLVLRP